MSDALLPDCYDASHETVEHDSMLRIFPPDWLGSDECSVSVKTGIMFVAEVVKTFGYSGEFETPDEFRYPIFLY